MVNKTTHIGLFIVVSLVLCMVSPVSVKAENYILTPVEDTFVRSNRPNKNYGSNNVLVSDGDPRSQVFIKFDTSLVQGNITSAVLQFTPVLTRNVTKNLHTTSDNWQENKLNWNNKPAVGELLTTFKGNVDAGSLSSIDLTSKLNGTVGDRVSILIDDVVEGYTLSMHSRESSLPPRLVLTTTDSPGTGTGGLPGDANGDGEVDEDDYDIWAQNVGNTTTLGAQAGDFNTNGVVDGVDFVIWLDNYGTSTQNPTSTPSPTGGQLSPTPTSGTLPTNTPAPSATSTPSPTNTSAPNPTPVPPPTGSNPYGIYPDCIAPAIGLETHSWWHEFEGENQPRHVHLATCLPNARSNTASNSPVVSGVLPAVFRIMAFNQPGYINWARYSWQSDDVGYHYFNPRLQCQSSPDELKECTWYINMNIDTSLSKTSGHDELRLSPNVQQDDLGTRQFATQNFQIHKGGTSHYRNNPNPIHRGWYTGLDYGNVTWTNYIALLNASDPQFTDTMPTVSGILSISVDHASCSGSVNTSVGYVDTNFHAVQKGEVAFPQDCSAVSTISGPRGCRIYQQPGCYEGTVTLDTKKLSNGIHFIYLQTQESDSTGMNAGAGKYFIKVQN